MLTVPRLQLFFLLSSLSLSFSAVNHASAQVLTVDTVWQGEVRVEEDVLVPRGVTLTVRPGTRVRVVAAESTKTDPEYLSPLTEITVRGTLKVEGDPAAPVKFSGEEPKPGNWAGIMVDGGSLQLSGATISSAEAGITLLAGNLRMQESRLQGNRYGLIVQGEKADALLEASGISGNDYGLLELQGARPVLKETLLEGNRKKDRLSLATREHQVPSILPPPPADLPLTRRYLDEVAMGDTVWQGRIQVAGVVRVPEGSRLIILPGTVVEFSRRDSNGDGIGENGLLIQGRLIAKGTKERPILFRSAEKTPAMGDWDAINIMNSAAAQNLIEFCRIQDAYRGLHFHFSNVTLRNSTLTNNYRAVQFQESLVDAQGNLLIGNKSGIQGRDSELTFTDNLLYGNYVGANFFRTTLTATNNRVSGSWKEGWRIREGVSALQGNQIDGNRQGLMLADMFYGSYVGNSFSSNLETGLSLKNADNIEVAGNIISANGITGLSVQESRALIRGNLVADNGERGVGVLSFDGIITENNLSANGRYAIDLDGPGDVAAPANWWGGDDPAAAVLDKRTDPGRGRVLYEKPAETAFSVAWPLAAITSDVLWRGRIAVNQNLLVVPGVQLTVAPDTVVQFAPGCGMMIKGRMLAKGASGHKILFTSQARKEPEAWDTVQLEYATGSVISHCIFEYATWGVHSHFTNLTVSDSIFRGNLGGMRFRSGPVEIRRSRFEGNSIGIRSYLGKALISDNDITGNETGIFVREKGGGLNITRNNLSANSSYNLRVGDFNDEDVPAANNWWGTADPLTTIFDGRNEPGIGKVLFEPFSATPLPDTGARP